MVWDSKGLGESVWSNRTSPKNLVLRLAEVGLLPPCSGPACPDAHNLTTTTSVTLEMVMIAWWPDFKLNSRKPSKDMSS